ncbi:MAG: Xaa-Pro peptidase family protein [Dehalococcoidia bacterium]
MKKPTYQYFSLEEYQQRLDALRSRMEEKGVDAMLLTTPENLYYLSGYQTPGYYWWQTIIVLLDREPVSITRRIEDANMRELAWIEDRRPYEDSDDWIAKTRDALVDLGLGSKTLGLEYDSYFLTARDYLRLVAAMPEASFVDCSGLVEQGRMIKSPQEIDYIRQAARTAEVATLAGIEAARVGATENDVAAEMHSAQIKAGSEYTGLPIFVASGIRSTMSHATWYRRTLEQNEVVFFEVPGCINRYHASLMRQVYLGDPPEVMVRGMEVVTGTLQMAKDNIRPGVPTGDVFEMVKESLDGADLGAKLERRTAYSIGIAFAPDWGEGHIISITRGEKRPFQVGMTFHLIPGVRVPGVGAINCSDTILVTEDGCETLTDGVERKLFVKN